MPLKRLLLRWITLSTLALCIAIGAAKVIGAVLPDDGLIVFTYEPQTQLGGNIGMFDTRTGIIINLTKRLHSGSTPHWSPDDTQIAFLSGLGGEISVMDRDGRNVHVVANFTGIFGNFTWSPDGSSIAYRSGMRAETVVRVVELSSGQDWLVFALESASLRLGIFQWSSEGRSILLEISTDDLVDWRMYRLNVNEPQIREIIWQSDSQFYVHPSGLYVVTLEENSLVLWNTETRTNQLLTSFPSIAGGPNWSPDGQIIAILIRTSINSQSDLYLINRDGSEERLLITIVNFYGLSWTSDSRHVSYMLYSGGEQRQMCIIDIDDGLEQCFTSIYFSQVYDWRP